MPTSKNAPSSDAIAGDAKQHEGYWLPEIVHVHLTALEAGWLTALLLDFRRANDVEINVRDENGQPRPTRMSLAIGEKLRAAWENHD